MSPNHTAMPAAVDPLRSGSAQPLLPQQGAAATAASGLGQSVPASNSAPDLPASLVQQLDTLSEAQRVEVVRALIPPRDGHKFIHSDHDAAEERAMRGGKPEFAVPASPAWWQCIESCLKSSSAGDVRCAASPRL